MSTVTHKVVKGDTLWALSIKYNTTIDSLVKLNNIKNKNLIYVGQVLYISGKPSSDGGSSSGGSSSSVSPPNNVNITAFGLQADTDGTIFVIWEWDRNDTKEYEVVWSYYTKNNIWFEGSNTKVDIKEHTYNAPSNATKVRVKIKPISTTYTSNDKEVSHWTADWSAYKEYNMDDVPPAEPGVPNVEVNDYSLTCKNDNLNVKADEIEFEIVQNDSYTFNKGVAKIITNSASYSCTVNVGERYKVRSRSKRGSSYSDWSNYSESVNTKPSTPSDITGCRATSKTSVSLTWNQVQTADTYDIEYATKKEYFEGSNATTTITGIKTLQYEVTGLGMGERYFFRIRAVNNMGESGWTQPASVVIGTKPSPPTTWSSTSTAIAGENLIFYWVHNSEDESTETFAEIEMYINNDRITQTVTNTDPDNKKTGQYILTTNNLVEGAVIRWRVRTAGITNEYGDWSVQRTVDVYAPPTLTVELLNRHGNPLTTLDSFPFYIRGIAGPITQKPISFHVSIISKETYETVDEIGNVKMVIAGEEVYSKFFDISTELMLEIMPGSVDLQNNISYSVVCVVAMDSGLSTQSTHEFNVSWIDELFTPNAEIAIDRTVLSTHIRPFCEYYPDIYYRVDYVNQKYVVTSDILKPLDGISVDNGFTEEGHVVYAGMYNNVMTHFCIIRSTTPTPVPDITLSVYRREFDGSFKEIGKGLINTNNTFVTDPHPALDYARYRIVAISNSTGSVSYTDLPAVPINDKNIIIQWDEKWTTFDTTNDEAIVEPSWVGSMLKLPYNISVSDSNTNDVSLVEYIGRSHPVSYYGTQLGVTSSWSVDIPKYDIETIYSLRRLSIWLGDVYVREPSGSGYWANMSVSFNQTYNELTIPVSMEISRVEGGV